MLTPSRPAKSGSAPASSTLPDIRALVVERIDGRTLTTAEPFRNRVEIWDFLDRYLGQVADHGLRTPPGTLEALPVVGTIRATLTATALPRSPATTTCCR